MVGLGTKRGEGKLESDKQLSTTLINLGLKGSFHKRFIVTVTFTYV